jgi:HAD superfamily hydrolase (TIGR01509 family)
VTLIKAVILDLDGTLVDTNYIHVEAWAQAFHEVGRTIPRAVIHHEVGKGSDQMLPELIGDPAVAERAKARHGELYRATQQHGYPLPGAQALLGALAARGIGLWLATSAEPDEVERQLEVLGARDTLTGIVSAGDVERSKPAPDLFQVALERAGVQPDEAVVLGDTVWDVAAARRAGLRTVAVLTGGSASEAELREAGAVAVYADCTALLRAGFPAGL